MLLLTNVTPPEVSLSVLERECFVKLIKVTMSLCYAQALRILHHGYPALNTLDTSFPYWSISQRKALVTISRTQTVPEDKTTTANRLRTELWSLVQMPSSGDSIRLRDLIRPLEAFIESPILSGYLSMLARSAPYESLEGMREELRENIGKEISSSQERYHPCAFNWDSIFSRNARARSFPILEGYPVSQELHDEIHHSLTRSRNSLHGQTLYPDLSNKTIGIEGQQNIRLNFGSILERPGEQPEYSLWDLERIRVHHGVEVSGRTEVRWAWKYNDLKPRIYYARGPDQHHSSKYIQEVFNTFIDSLPTTHRFLRFFIQSVQGASEETAFIYDYSSFTSYLEEIRNFTEALGRFCQGIVITTIDLARGPVLCDLGKMISDYNIHCNCDPEFDGRGILGVPFEDDLFLRHTCGMLGVPGNISSCTLLHGIHLAILLGSLVKGKVVGDDAAGWKVLSKYGRVDLLEKLSNIGKISAPKMNFWEPDDDADEQEDSTWHYVKRPIDRYLNRLAQGRQAVWPSIPEILNLVDEIHTSSNSRLTVHERFKKISSMLLSFILQFSSYQPAELESFFIDRFLRTMISRSGLSKYESESGRSFVYPHRYFGGHPVDELKDLYWTRSVTIPDDVTMHNLRFPGKEMAYVGRSNKAIQISVGLGHCVVENRWRQILPCYEEAKFDAYLSKDLTPVYDIFIKISIPSWLFRLVEDRYTQSHVDTESDW